MPLVRVLGNYPPGPLISSTGGDVDTLRLCSHAASTGGVAIALEVLVALSSYRCGSYVSPMSPTGRTSLFLGGGNRRWKPEKSKGKKEEGKKEVGWVSRESLTHPKHAAGTAGVVGAA